MSCLKYLLNFCFIVVITAILYLLFTNQYNSIVQSISIPFKSLLFRHKNVYLISGHIGEEKMISSIDLDVSQPLFQSQLSPHYPYFPIHIYTQNLTSLRNTTKLILLGNSLFGDKQWGFGGIGKSQQKLMTYLMCPYLANYCDITNDKSFFSDADAVVYHMRDDINLKEARRNRQPEQRFVFALWESPIHTPNLQSYKGFFNWTMTYRSTSHVVASYYFGSSYMHTSSSYYDFIIKENATKNLGLQFKKMDYRLSNEMLANKKLGTVAAIISNCGSTSRRIPFIKQLKRYIDVKVYGRCGEACPTNVDCRGYIANNYYFFLSFENSLCTDYTTEKFFSTIQYPIVPVVLGRTNYSSLIPSSGFIDTNDFADLNSLAQFLKQIRHNKEKYLSYFSWKQDYVWGASVFSTPFCDLCLRLHLDSTPNVIDDIDAWWNQDTCQKPRKFKFT